MAPPLRDERAAAQLADRGWARLPALDPERLARLAEIAAEIAPSLARLAQTRDVGFDELWGAPDPALRRATQARIGAVLAPFLAEHVVGHRPVLFTLWVKRESSPDSTVPFHQDLAFVDERGGQFALQVWIPLVDVSAENGALILVEGTHRDASPIRPHDHKHPLAAHAVTSLPPGAVQPELRAGEGVVFSNRTVHGSPPNRTDSPRLAVGAVLAPMGVPLAHWTLRAPNAMELWTLSDDDVVLEVPGELPAGARLVDTVAIAPSSRVDFGGAWLCYRAFGSADRVVVTDAGGRFVFLGADEIDAIARGASDPREPRRVRLEELGFLRASADPPPAVPLVAAPPGVALVFDPRPDVHEQSRPLTGAPPFDVVARELRALHDRFADVGIDREAAYVNVVSPVTRASVAGGARAYVDAARALGLTYVELPPVRGPLAPSPREYLAFYADAIDRIVAENTRGALLVEKRVALHLEVLAATGTRRRLDVMSGEGCAPCAYERLCGTTLVEAHVAQGNMPDKRWGSAWCETSMGTLDAIFARLDSPNGTALRRVFTRWMKARDRVAARTQAR